MWANIHQVVSSDFQQLHQKIDVLNAFMEHQLAQTLQQHQCRHLSLHQGYFIPMLSFIPLALFGGLQTPSPWDGNYNKEAPKPTIPAEENW